MSSLESNEEKILDLVEMPPQEGDKKSKRRKSIKNLAFKQTINQTSSITSTN